MRQRQNSEAKVKAIAEAITEGRSWYWGSLCTYGHDGRRYLGGDNPCVDCERERYIENRDRHKGRRKEHWKEIREQENAKRKERWPEIREQKLAQQKQRRKENPEKVREWDWKAAGIRSAKNYPHFLKWPEFLEKVYEQLGLCATCDKVLAITNAPDCVPDHCKETHIFRRVLCMRCNIDDGMISSSRGQRIIKDNAVHLARAKLIIASMEFHP